MPFGPTHTVIRNLASWAVSAFYSSVVVVGEEHVPPEGPLIVCSNHWAMTVDPAVLSVTFPHKRKLHYWAKSGLFKVNKLATTILLDAGNLPVDRKEKNNQLLFKSTFDVLKLGECVAIFPEGTSYTQPRIMAIKDGVGWTALEYAKNIRTTGASLSGDSAVASTITSSTPSPTAQDVTIAICGINYISKTKYRSSVLVEYAPSISIGPYVEAFMSESPEERKAAVKALVGEVEKRMRSVTLDAEDWETLWSAEVARQVLWEDEKRLPLRYYRDTVKRLVGLFSGASVATDSRLVDLKALLVSYSQSLTAAHLQHSSLSGVPLPSSLDPAVPTPLPGRLRTLWVLLLATARSLVQLPFFALPMIVHVPLYVIGYLGGRLQEEKEATAQNKIVLGLLFCFLLYPVLFFVLWFVLFATPLSAMIAFGLTWLFAIYHISLIDTNYAAAKRLLASWRILISVWTYKAVSAVGSVAPSTSGTTKVQDLLSADENRVRRVLRLRVLANAALVEYLAKIEKEGGEKAELVRLLRSRGAVLPRLKTE